MGRLIQRRVQGIARKRITESPVVLLQGPRSVGKSTLLRALAEEHGGRVVDFDEPAVRAAAADDPGLFVVGEVLKQASWLELRPHVGHWRTRDGSEVDLVLEDGNDGSVIGIEVKASGRVHRRDRHGLRRLRETLGKRFVAGVVFYTGAHCVRYRDDERVIALPIDRLWTGASA